MKLNNHETNKLIITSTVALVIGTCFFIWDEKIKDVVGYSNYYMWLSYCSVFPPVLINKIYDWGINKYYDKTEVKLAQGIQDDVTLEGEAELLKQEIKNKRNEQKRNLEKYKAIRESRRTM